MGDAILWLDQLAELVARHADQGVDRDINAMTLCELHGAARYLRRVDAEMVAA